MSTVHAAAELVEQIASAIDGQRCCAGVFIYLKKAFDTVDHELLVEKLKVYGIRGVANKWLQNYLTHRKQYVVIDDTYSDMLDMTCGVPQGSVLGPILYWNGQLVWTPALGLYLCVGDCVQRYLSPTFLRRRHQRQTLAFLYSFARWRHS